MGFFFSLSLFYLLRKKKRVEVCRKNLKKIRTGKWRLCDIITGDESWFYFRYLAHKCSNASWVAEGESPLPVVRRNRFEAKRMFAIFFKSDGLVHIVCLDRGTTMTGHNYIEKCLKPVVSTIKTRRPKSGTTNMKILHDNARPHVTKMVKNYTKEEGLSIIDHPPYSPDLAPLDFWLFDYIKQRLRDYNDAESLKNAITRILLEIPKEEYLKTFHKWVERMQLCVDNQGDYFEHLIKKK